MHNILTGLGVTTREIGLTTVHINRNYIFVIFSVKNGLIQGDVFVIAVLG